MILIYQLSWVYLSLKPLLYICNKRIYRYIKTLLTIASLLSPFRINTGWAKTMIYRRPSCNLIRYTIYHLPVKTFFSALQSFTLLALRMMHNFSTDPKQLICSSSTKKICLNLPKEPSNVIQSMSR